MKFNKTLLIACFIVMQSLASITIHAQKGAAQLRTMANAWMDALNRHDTDAIAKMYSDDAQLESPNWQGVKTGSAGAIEVYGRYFISTPDLQQKITHLITTDSNIVIEYVSSGTLLHPEKSTPEYMRGKKYTLQNCTRLDVINGKIVRQMNYFDQVAFLRQVGFFDQH
jgi:steroid delta-isomerase-like uncharacterized protein